MEDLNLVKEIADNYSKVKDRIESACAGCGRDPSSVTLIAVVKTFGPETIRAAYSAGLMHFGESYAQDFRDKAAALDDLPGLHWHYIGKIQTNKVRYIAGKTELIHAVDRIETAEAISKRNSDNSSPQDILVSVNLGQEITKSGIDEDNIIALCSRLNELRGIRLRGFMCLPPWSDNPEDSRPFFRRLAKIREKVYKALPETGADQLSMGMSHDLETAIEEGATMIRVGTALLGERNRRK